MNTMFSVLSTSRFLCASERRRHNQQMVYKPDLSSFAGRLEYVWRTCGYDRQADFARSLGVTPQNLGAWIRRGGFGQGASILHEVTGVNTDWLRTGKGIDFLEGPKKAAAPRAADPFTVKSLEYAVKALVSTMAAERSDEAAKMAAAIRKHSPPQYLADGTLLAGLCSTLDAGASAGRRKARGA